MSDLSTLREELEATEAQAMRQVCRGRHITSFTVWTVQIHGGDTATGGLLSKALAAGSDFMYRDAVIHAEALARLPSKQVYDAIAEGVLFLLTGGPDA